MLAAVKNKPCGCPLKERPFLTAPARGSPAVAQAGAEEWLQPNKGMLLGCVMPLPTRFLKEAENNIAFHAIAEAFLARHLGGRAEPIGADFAGSSHEVREGKDIIEGLGS